MSRLLLDTHALIWWVTDDGSLTRKAYSLIADPTNDVFVSAATAWEISTKARLRKLTAGPLAQELVAEVHRQGFSPLAITLEHASRAGSLPGPHRDPFDRMLIAQAQAENLALVSNETDFDGYGVQRIW